MDAGQDGMGEDGTDGGGPGDMVTLRNLGKTFQMGTRDIQALRDVSMDIPGGSMAVVQGTSGSGKTTLLNIIGAMDVPTTGTVRVAGQDLSRLTEEALTDFRRRNVGFVFQFFNLISSLNAAENVLVPTMFDPKKPVARALSLLETVGLADRWDHRPSQLSGGERQRLAVARALIHDPPLVLADEPTGNLDHDTGAGIIGLFRELVEDGRTVVVVTHDPEVASSGDLRFLLRDGELSEYED